MAHKLMRWHVTKILKELDGLHQLPLEPSIHSDIRLIRAKVESWAHRTNTTTTPKTTGLRRQLEATEQIRALAGDLQTKPITEDVANALRNLEDVCTSSVRQMKGLADG